MIETIAVSSRGQIVIPERIRNELNIKEGTKLIILEKDNVIRIEKEETFLTKLESVDKDKEMFGWLALAEKSMAEIWDNETDEKTWGKYL